MLSSVLSSSRSVLSAEQALKLINTHLNNARDNIEDINLALIFCDHAEVSLSQAKSAFKKALSPNTPDDQALRTKIGTVYAERGKLLEKLGQSDKAKTSYEKAAKYGYVPGPFPSPATPRPSSTRNSIYSALIPSSAFVASPRHSSPLSQRSTGRDIAVLPPALFAQNVLPPLVKYDLPKADERLSSTPQLAYALSVLSAAALSDAPLSAEERAWSQATAENADETERLQTLATDVVRAFINDELKEATTVTEAVCVALSANHDLSRNLLTKLVKEIQQSPLLTPAILEGIDQLISDAAPGTLEVDDLVQLLTLLSTRLQETHGQATANQYQLTRTISHLVDAMAESEVSGLQREKLHEPLAAYLQTLQNSEEPYLVYQAAYAYQALQYVPDDETPWQAALRRTGKVLEGVFGLVSAVKGLNLNEFIEGLEKIQEGTAGAIGIIKTVAEVYEGTVSLTNSGQNFLTSLKEGFSFTRKRDWYPTLRLIDTLLQTGQLAQLKQLVCEAPCRRDPAFQWGLVERLGQLAAHPAWEASIRQHAVNLLGELYQDEASWGRQANVKQWIVQILNQLAETSVSATAAKTALQTLEKVGNADKQTLYQTGLQEGSCSSLLNVASSLPVASTLLDRVQNKLDVETDLRKLKHRRVNEHSDAVYIAPQGKPSRQAPAETLFELTPKVNEFLSSDKKVLLLLGDSGAGKSTFNRRLETDLWTNYKKGERIPLFINLPAIDKPEHDLIGKHLRKEGLSEPQIKELKAYREFIIICDGYDESQQTHNLYMSNQFNQSGQWQAQMVISCRSEYLGADYRDRFQPIDRNQHADSTLFEEAVIAPFSAQKIASYIERYVQREKSVWQVETYQQALERIPHLRELVSNPFLLTLALEVLPSLVAPGQDFSSARITRVALYDQFVMQWLERGKKRLEEKVLSERKKEAFERLASEGFTRNGLAFFTKLASAIYEQQAGNPVVEYTRFMDEGTWKEVFFGRDDEKQLLLEANPLIRNDNQHRFIHKSLLEYGVARAIFEPQEGSKDAALTPTLTRRGSVDSVLSFESQHAADDVALAVEQPLLDSLLARKNLVGEPSILQFLAERVQQEPLFKEQLLAVIERSKTDSTVRRAAANAITILVRAAVQFNGVDLQGIQIPGADLSWGVFDTAQLQGADLRKVNLRNSWLRQANLSRAKMDGVQFGEWPYLQEESAVTVCTYSPDGKTCALGLENGTISVYETSTWEKRFTLVGHTGEVTSVAYSPSSAQIASCSGSIFSRDETVRLWDAQSGQLSHTLVGHFDRVTSVVYSPSGAQLASSSGGYEVWLWDAQSGQLSHILTDHTRMVNSVVYSPSGAQLASCSDDQTVRLWDAQSGQLSHTLTGHTKAVNSVAYSPSGAQLASSSHDQTVRLWDAQSGQLSHTLAGHTRWVTSVVYSPSSTQLASSSYDNTVRLWDAQSGQLSHTLAGHTSEVNSVVYSPSGAQLASCSDDKTVRLWDAQSGQLSHTLAGHTEKVNSVVYSPSGAQLASRSDDQTVRRWDAQSGQPSHTLAGHTAAVQSVVYSPSGAQIASRSWDNTVRLWDAQSGQLSHTLAGHTSEVKRVAYSPSGAQLASSSHDQTVRLWDAQSGQLSHTLTGHTKAVTSVVYSPNGAQIASRSYDKTVRLWDAQSGQLSHTLVGHTDDASNVVYSPSGAQLASSSHDKTVRLWDAQSGQLSHTLVGHTDKVTSVVYSPSSTQLASSSDDKTVRLWDAQSGQLSHTLAGHTDTVTSVVYSPSGAQLASCSAGLSSHDNTVRLWDAQSGQLSHTLHGHTGWVWSVAYSPSGAQLASSSGDQTVRLWDAQSGQLSHTLAGHTSWVNSVVYSPSGAQLASRSGDQTVRLWDAQSGQCLAVVRNFGGEINSIAWRETTNGTYFVTGCADKSVRVWQIIEDESQTQVRLQWSSTHDRLAASDTVIQGVQGLSQVSKKLLVQRGAVGEPASRLGETSKRAMNVAAAVSKFRAPLARKTLDSLPAAQPDPSTLALANPSLPGKEPPLFSHLA